MPGPHKNSGELAKQQAERTNPLAVVDSTMRAAANMMTFGYADKFAAWMDSTIKGTSQEENLAREKAITALDAKNNPKAVLTGQVAGVVLGPLALKSAYGFVKGAAAGYAGATATASVASTAAGATATEAVHTTARSVGAKVASSAKNAATMVRENPVEATKTVLRMGGRVTGFVAKQVGIVWGSQMVGVGAEIAPKIYADSAEQAVGPEALKVTATDMMPAAINAGVAIGLGVLTRGRSGSLAQVGQGISIMTGVAAAMQGSAQVIASTSSSIQEKDYGNAAQSAGYLGATVAAIAGAARLKNIGMQHVWNHLAENRISYAMAGFSLTPYLKFVGKLTDHKIQMAHMVPQSAPDPAAVELASNAPISPEAPVSTAEVAAGNAPTITATSDKAPAASVRVAHAHAARPRKQAVAKATFLGLDPEAKVGLSVASLPVDAVGQSAVGPEEAVPDFAPAADTAIAAVNTAVLGNALAVPDSAAADGKPTVDPLISVRADNSVQIRPMRHEL